MQVVDYNQNAKLRVQNTLYITNRIGVYAFLALVAIFILIPFYWMINVSFQSDNEVFDSINIYYYPSEFSPSNFTRAFNYSSSATGGIGFSRYLLNTIVVAVASTVLGTLCSILVAFALARLNFKGRETIFAILLATMMIPGEIMVMTNFVTIKQFGWLWADSYKSYYAMVIPFLVSIFHIYLLRQNFKQVPNELYYAAKVDGCNDFKYLWRIMVPMAKSSIVTIIILKLMGTWNAYIWPNLVADNKYKLVTTWLRSSFVVENRGIAINIQMAATIMVTLPLLLLFVCFRKYIMSGVSRSGLKG